MTHNERGDGFRDHAGRDAWHLGAGAMLAGGGYGDGFDFGLHWGAGNEGVMGDGRRGGAEAGGDGASLFVPEVAQ